MGINIINKIEQQCQECEEYFRSSKEKKFTPLSIEFLVNKCEKYGNKHKSLNINLVK